MIVRVAWDGAVTLEDPDDFKRFKMVVDGRPAEWEATRAILGRLATFDDANKAWVRADGLRALVPDPTPAWEEGLSVMVAFARDRGWIRDDPLAIAAHVEWTEPVAVAGTHAGRTRGRP